MPKIRFAAVGALCLLVVSLDSGVIRAASAEATLTVRLPGFVTSAAQAGGGPIRIGVPADGFTVTGLDVSTKAIARVVITNLINGAECYGEDGGFVIVEVDPEALAAIKAEIELSNSSYGDPATRMTSRYVAPTHRVGGSWSSNGTTLTVTLRLVDAQGKQLISKSGTGLVSQYSEINARVAKALAAAIPCPRPPWIGRVTSEVDNEPYVGGTQSLKIVANVTFEWNESLEVYKPTGTWTFEYRMNHKEMTVTSLGSGSIVPEDGALAINPIPPHSYDGGGLSHGTIERTTVAANGFRQTTSDILEIPWWDWAKETDLATVRPDGSIDGSSSVRSHWGTMKVHWHFDSAQQRPRRTDAASAPVSVAR